MYGLPDNETRTLNMTEGGLNLFAFFNTKNSSLVNLTTYPSEVQDEYLTDVAARLAPDFFGYLLVMTLMAAFSPGAEITNISTLNSITDITIDGIIQ